MVKMCIQVSEPRTKKKQNNRKLALIYDHTPQANQFETFINKINWMVIYG